MDETIEEKLLTLTISRKHGKTLVRTLRDTYSTNFASHCADHEKLASVMHKMDAASLADLMRDHKTGKLAQICSDRPAQL